MIKKRTMLRDENSLCGSKSPVAKVSIRLIAERALPQIVAIIWDRFRDPERAVSLGATIKTVRFVGENPANIVFLSNIKYFFTDYLIQFKGGATGVRFIFLWLNVVFPRRASDEALLGSAGKLISEVKK